MSVQERHAAEPYAYLTTTGRVSGHLHEIEIWFAARSDTLYLMNGGGRRGPGSSDWVQNLRAHPRAEIRIGDETFAVRARFIEIDSDEHELARELLVSKYASGPGDLEGWRRTAFPVALEVEVA